MYIYRNKLLVLWSGTAVDGERDVDGLGRNGWTGGKCRRTC